MLLPLLQKRRSIRKFLPQPVEQDKVTQLEESLLRSYSSRGNNPWEFIVVNQPEILEKLSKAKEHGSGFLAGAPLAVVICADTGKSDVWVEDCAIAATILQLSAASLGLGSCWAQIRQRTHGQGQSAEDFIREMFGMDERYSVAVVVGIGYADEHKEGHAFSSLQFDKIHHNGFVSR